MGYLQRYLWSNKKDKLMLKEARTQIDKLKSTSYDPHKFTLATIYSEESLCGNNSSIKTDLLKKAQNIFEDLIEKNKKPERLQELCDAYWNYSLLLNKHKLYEEETHVLEWCLRAFWDNKGKPNKSVAAAAKRSQEKLLDYSTLTIRDRSEKYTTVGKAYELKHEIFCSMKNYPSAIFYMTKAIDETNEESRIISQMNNLILVKVNQSEEKRNLYLLKEANTLINQLPNGTAKHELKY